MPPATRFVLSTGLALLVVGAGLLAGGLAISGSSPSETFLRTYPIAQNETIVSGALWTSNATAVLPLWYANLTGQSPTSPNGLLYEYASHPGLPLPTEIKDDRVNFSWHVQVTRGLGANLYLMNAENYTRWVGGDVGYPSFSPFLSFGNFYNLWTWDFFLARPDAVTTLIVVIEQNNRSGPDPRVVVWMNASWAGPASPAPLPYFNATVPAIREHIGAIRLLGNVSEASGLPFRFYVLDQDGFENWSHREAFDPLYRMDSLSYGTVFATLPESAASGTTLSIVAENPELVDQELTVRVSLEVTWHASSDSASILKPAGWACLLVGASTVVVGRTMATISRRPRN